MSNKELITYCRYCKNQKLKYFSSTSDYHYGNAGVWDTYRCPKCKHIYQSPIPDDKELSKYYPKTYYSFQEVKKYDFKPSITSAKKIFLRMNFLKKERGYNFPNLKGSWIFSFLYKVLLSKPLYFDDFKFILNGTYLDYGCGSGGTVGIMQYFGWNAEGVDITRKAVENGIKSGLNLRCGSNEQLDDYNNYYDVIYSSHTFEHVSDIDILFKKLYNSLKHNGLMTFTIPNGNAASIDIYKDDFYFFTMPVHINLFTSKSIEIALKNVGFTDILITTGNRWKYQISSYYVRRKKKQGIKINFGDHTKIESKLGYISTFFNYLKSLKKFKGDNLFVTCKK